MNDTELDYEHVIDKKLSKLENLIESFDNKGSICHIKGIIDVSSEISETMKSFDIKSFIR